METLMLQPSRFPQQLPGGAGAAASGLLTLFVGEINGQLEARQVESLLE